MTTQEFERLLEQPNLREFLDEITVLLERCVEPVQPGSAWTCRKLSCTLHLLRTAKFVTYKGSVMTKAGKIAKLDRPPGWWDLGWARGLLGMTQAALAKAIGVSRVTVARWEMGAMTPEGENSWRFWNLVSSYLSDLRRIDRPALAIDRLRALKKVLLAEYATKAEWCLALDLAPTILAEAPPWKIRSRTRSHVHPADVGACIEAAHHGLSFSRFCEAAGGLQEAREIGIVRLRHELIFIFEHLDNPRFQLQPAGVVRENVYPTQEAGHSAQ